MALTTAINSKQNIILVAISMMSYSSHGLAANSSVTAQAKLTAFTNANILEPTVELPITDATILVANGEIVKIQPDSAAIPDKAKQVDLNDGWVIPGLIDGHVHLAQSGGAFTRPDIVDATNIHSYQDDQDWLLNNQKQLLENYTRLGITSIFDLGGPDEYLPRYQEFSQNANLPEIYFAGSLLSPMEVPKLNANGVFFNKTDSSKAAIKSINKQLENGTDILKIVWSHETGLSSQQLLDIYQPAINYAKKQNLVIAIHVEELAGAKMAVKAGADILVHGVMREKLDDELISLMKSNHVTYMHTLTAYQRYFEFFKGELQFSQFEKLNSAQTVTESFNVLSNNLTKTNQMLQIFFKYMPKVDETDENIAKLSQQEQSIVKQLKSVFSSQFIRLQKQNLKKVADADINISLGTDAGNLGTLHGASLLGEIYAWQAAGISNKDILKATTSGTAIAFDMENTIGSLSTGKRANFVVLANNPYQDITTLAQPSRVIKQGVTVFKAKEQ